MSLLTKFISSDLSSRKSKDGHESNEIVWNFAEAAFQGTHADVLEIFDCCYAGDLGRQGGFSTR